MHLAGWCERIRYMGYHQLLPYYRYHCCRLSRANNCGKSVASMTGSWVSTWQESCPTHRSLLVCNTTMLPRNHRTIEGQTDIRCSRKGPRYWERCFPQSTQVCQAVLSPLGNNYTTSKMAVLLMRKYRAKEHLPGETVSLTQVMKTLLTQPWELCSCSSFTGVHVFMNSQM